MASGRSQPQTGTPWHLAGVWGCRLQTCVTSQHFGTHPDAHLQVLLRYQCFPRSPLPQGVGGGVGVGLQLPEGCPVPCVKEWGLCWGYIKHRRCPRRPGPAQRGGSTTCCHSRAPCSLPAGLCCGLLGLDSHLLCAATHTRAAGRRWTQAQTGPSGQQPKPRSTEANGSEGTNQALNIARSEPLPLPLRAGVPPCWHPAISLPSSMGTPGRAPAKPKQPPHLCRGVPGGRPSGTGASTGRKKLGAVGS